MIQTVIAAKYNQIAVSFFENTKTPTLNDTK